MMKFIRQSCVSLPGVVLLFLPVQLLAHHSVTIVTFDQLMAKISSSQNDTLYVVNYWATWCQPCVHELPDFQNAYKKFSGKKVTMVFVSLNSKREITAVQKFAANHDLQPEVLLLNGDNPNDWINNVDSSWSGTIPATVMYKRGKKIYFHEGEMTEEMLNNSIQSNIN